jgi:hypothetical protein
MTCKETSGRCSSSQGFTRVDLIACLAATTLLAALGASALSSSKDNVNRMVCASNMRQLALAGGMYAADNRDYMAYCNWDGGAGTDPLPGWLYTLPVPLGLPGAGSDRIPDPFISPWASAGGSGGLTQSAWMSGVYFPYVKNVNSYLCPTDIQSRDWTAEPAGANGPGRNNKLSSYVMNGAACNFGGTPTICKVSDVWSPDCYLLWEVDENQAGPGVPGALAFNDGANYPTAPPLGGGGGLGAIHGDNGGEVITVGGSVNFVTLNSFNSQSLTPGPRETVGRNFVWWASNLPNGGQ